MSSGTDLLYKVQNTPVNISSEKSTTSSSTSNRNSIKMNLRMKNSRPRKIQYWRTSKKKISNWVRNTRDTGKKWHHTNMNSTDNNSKSIWFKRSQSKNFWQLSIRYSFRRRPRELIMNWRLMHIKKNKKKKEKKTRITRSSNLWPEYKSRAVS